MLSLAIAAPNAHAQAQRTWVSGVGDDANPCSRTAPCKTFAGAISKTAAGGEINAIDPGGYGAVTITKSMRIDGTNTMAGVLAGGTNGIVISAGADDVVVLRGLSINGARVAGTYRGIRFISGKALIIENCQVTGFGQRGISIETTAGNSQVFITNTDVGENLANGVVVQPGTGATTKVVLDNVRIHDNISFGVSITPGSSVLVRNTTVSNNGLSAFRVDGSTANTTLDLNSVVISGNSVGISAGPGSSVTRMASTTIVGNGTGISNDGGTVYSAGNNSLIGNTNGNGPMAPMNLQ